MKCRVDRCRTKTTSGALCTKHRNQLYSYRLSEEGMAARQSTTCQVVGCGGRQQLGIDHDSTCCPRGLLHKTTCGRCTRGQVCGTCRTELRMLATPGALIERIPARRRTMLLAYLELWAPLTDPRRRLGEGPTR